ncbi:MAG: BlaI/MecI/CopY family transcriptional regulator [Firmicutes bacterium]|nr:BlaI/MecI/CopY family transcriptional regulator [Bacillota bacterium]
MKNKNISNSEWKIMKVLWETPYITLRQIYEKAGVSEGWSYTTVRTLVTRLVDKEAAAADKSGTNFKYYPLLSENECKNSEVKNFLDKVFDGRKSMLMVSLTKDSNLTVEETKTLMSLIEKIDN